MEIFQWENIVTLNQKRQVTRAAIGQSTERKSVAFMEDYLPVPRTLQDNQTINMPVNTAPTLQRY